MNPVVGIRGPCGTLTLAVIVTAVVAPSALGNPFAAAVVRYDPAPGQNVNNVAFNDPAKALGPPVGGGLDVADNSSVVTLGGFGGSITLAFDHTVMDDPLNPYGMDAIVFGNAFWAGGDPDFHWAECATIELSLDKNGNDLADDAWYLVRGSHILTPSEQWRIATWDDDVADATYPPDLMSWIPPGLFGLWTTQAFELPAELFGALVVINPSAEPDREAVFGYADYSPTLLLGDTDADGYVDDPRMEPANFYTVPDDPRAVGISPGAGGGDAFDIAWAVDPDSGLPARLSGFDFIRLTTAVNVIAGPLGEKSAEIDAVADATTDPTGDADADGDIDLADLATLQLCFESGEPLLSNCIRLEHEPNDLIDGIDAGLMLKRVTGPK